MRKWKRSTAILLAAVMAAGGVTGCGKKADSTGTAGTEAGTTGVSDNLNAEGLPILKEKETFKIAVKQKSTIRAAAEKQCVIDTENATNVKIEWIEIPNSGWQEKINIMFSTDSLPDAIIGSVDMAKYYEQCVELDEYLDAYGPAVKEMFENSENYPQALTAPDGKIHMLPAGDESTENLIDSQMWINSDWLKKVGKEMPSTPAQLKEVLVAFRDQDPNGNGIKDEIPFTFREAWGWGDSIGNLFGPWGVVENDKHVFTKDGTVTFSPKEQGYYDALLYFHDLYQEGLIDKEAFAMSTDQYSARGAGGDILGMTANYNGDGCNVDNGVPGQERYVPLPLLKGEDGQQMTYLNNPENASNFIITKSCKNPEALVRWYDYINSSVEQTLVWGRGEQGVRWELKEENGMDIPVFLTMTPEALASAGGYKNGGEYRNAVSFGGDSPSLWRLDYDQRLQYDDKAPKPNWKKESVMEQKEHGVLILPPGMSSQENEERRVMLKIDIDNYLKKFIADSVINGIDESKWEKHLNTLGDLKADEYTKLCQEFVDEYEKR